MTDFANPAAAVTAGYIKTQIDRGASAAIRYATILEINVNSGEAGTTPFRAYGESNSSAAAADTQANVCLNEQRIARYGAGATAGLTANGKTLTFDA